MKKLIFGFCMLIGTLWVVTAAEFTDTQESVYKQDITELASLNIVKGYPDGSFKPKQAITRA